MPDVAETEETKYWGGQIPVSRIEQLRQQADQRGLKLGRILNILTKLWVQLPPDLQAQLYYSDAAGEKPLKDFMHAVNKVIHQRVNDALPELSRLEKHHRAGRSRDKQGTRRRKPGSRGASESA